MSAKLLILGSSNAVPTLQNDNTQLAIITDHSRVLVDCGVNPTVKLEQAGLEVNEFTDIIITHFHPDHVSGLPMFLMTMWLTQRTSTLTIHGSEHTITRIQQMLELFDWQKWPNFYPVHFHIVEMQPHALVLNTPDLAITGTPVKHFIPTMGLRIGFTTEDKIIGYSCDTEPCPGVDLIAKDVDLLIHESTGQEPGHSSAVQAAEAATRGNVGALMLIHYPSGKFQKNNIVAEASVAFSGKITRAEDMLSVSI